LASSIKVYEIFFKPKSVKVIDNMNIKKIKKKLPKYSKGQIPLTEEEIIKRLVPKKND